jgi:hypothetical protein
MVIAEAMGKAAADPPGRVLDLGMFEQQTWTRVLARRMLRLRAHFARVIAGCRNTFRSGASRCRGANGLDGG